jgi:hypothetical protein
VAISDDSGVDFRPRLFVCASEIRSQVKVCFLSEGRRLSCAKQKAE